MATRLMHISFYNSLWFLVENGNTSSNYFRLSIFQIFSFLETLLKLCFPSFPLIYLYQRKRKMTMTFTRNFFAFTKSDWALLLERYYFIFINRPACFYPKLVSLMQDKQKHIWIRSKIYEWDFFAKIVNGLKPLFVKYECTLFS